MLSIITSTSDTPGYGTMQSTLPKHADNINLYRHGDPSQEPYKANFNPQVWIIFFASLLFIYIYESETAWS